MRIKGRYVFDTNVVVSALLFENSNPSRALQSALRLGAVLLSPELLEELGAVLGRQKFDRFVSREQRDEFLEALVERSILVDVVEKVRECRDPKDDKILELALNGGADYIISGDRDLLVLSPFREVKIVTPEEFLRIGLGEAGGSEAIEGEEEDAD
ncbi:MAG: putative toxin-antitoxin system toxin component, PIN family [Coleofasciculaceae cyanobacterium SM2_1_6]|nr:putative toxin-antitoxin system toxin component, PIN family [Coleofasciculaceae cyanobacterium SM2_1_6]